MLEIELDDLTASFQEIAIKLDIDSSKFKSIKDVKVFYRKVKSKWIIFPITKRELIVKILVDESLYFAEVLAEDLRVNQYIDEYVEDEYELELEYV